MKKIIFHHPLPLNPNATSASGIRPLRMLDAFRSLGYQVDVVAGYSAERKVAINEIKKNIKSGVKYDFVYSESSTMPTVLTDPHHLPLHPLLDFSFFRFCKKNNIKTGLFYRDIYWLFDSYSKNLSWFKSTIAKLAYKYELYFYKRYLEKLYLPSLEMGKYVPIVPSEKFIALPPGHDTELSTNSPSEQKDQLKLFYVGGMSDHYQMHTLFKVINERDDVEFTLCTRESEWQAVKDDYPDLSQNIKIVHKSGEAMQALMLASDAVSIFVKPQEYREFAAPVKLYEYLGNCKPIIATQGTLAGKFVSENKIGWSLPYAETALHELFDQLKANSKLLENVQQHMHKVAQNHTWQARAKQVVKDLTQ